MHFELIDCCPAPERLIPLLITIKAETGCTYQSIFRGTEARRLLAKCGKHDQAYLYAHQHDPGFNPANPPGRSTHECRSDAVAYRGPVGRRLRWWQVGIDVDDAHVAAFIAAANRHGWHAHITYPGSASEYHHINLTKRPKYSPAIWWRIRPVKRGSKGPRAAAVVRILRGVPSPKTGERYLKPRGKAARHIGAQQEAAIKHFQRDHHQKADGVVGIQTWRQMQAAKRNHKRKAKK